MSSSARRVSRRVAAITPSATLAVDAQAKALKAAGENVIGFGAGEPDFPTPDHIVEAAVAACRDPKNHRYTPAPGLPELRAAVAEKTRRDSGYEVTADQVVITNGGKHAVYNAFAALLDPGDEVLLPAPYWTTYPEPIRLAGGVPVEILAPEAAGFRVTVDQLEAARTPDTKAMVFVSPSNPTGAVYPRDEVEAIGRWAAENEIWVVTDEIYEHLTYDEHEFHSIATLVPEVADRCLVLNGVAKTYAMTGWRVGWIVGPTDVVKAAAGLQSHQTSNVANVSQRAALAAVSGSLDDVVRMRESFDRRGKRMHQLLNAIEGVSCMVPQGAFYAFPSFEEVLQRGSVAGRPVRTTVELAAVILEEAKVAIVPGEAFAAPGYARLSFALGDDDLGEGITRIADLLAVTSDRRTLGASAPPAVPTRPENGDGGGREVRAYGTWPSALAVEALVAGSRAVGEVRVDGDDVWWSEARPDEGGRTQLVRRRVDGTTHDVLGPDGNARTGLYEYGGGAWCVESGVVVFAQWADQRLHRLVADDPDGVAVPITPAPEQARGLRYGDVLALNHGWVLAVREAHPGEAGVPADAPEARHDIVAVPTDGSAADDADAVRVLVTGPDFVASPVPGPARLAWIRWQHPLMPWDGTELCVARLRLDAGGAPVIEGEPVVVAGGPEESVVEPAWSADGSLWACSDRSDWWNLHRVADPGGPGPDGEARVVGPIAAEIGGPRWVGGLRGYAVLGDGRILAGATADGTTGLVLVDPSAPDRPPTPVALDVGGSPVTVVSQVVAGPGPSQAVVVVASATAESTPVLVELPPAVDAPGSDGGRGRTAAPTVGVLRPERELPLTPADIAPPEAISFPSAGGRTAHGVLYRPASASSVGPADERPPLVVMIHGGPTAAARPLLDLRTQLWTTRGFAVVDVDYGGSTGYGRPYRRLLDDAWGVVDVEDCIAAARHLAAEGVVDGARVVIRGGSAGGFTTLAALCTSDVFAAGTSLYGVTDLGALARDTHKFESRYLDGLVGPWPEAADVYAARSPLNQLDGLATPVLVLQGADDMVVPPSQAEAVVAAVAAKGLPHAYLLFAGEGHGFRQADTIVRAVQAELAFYGQVLGFTPADDLSPLPATATPGAGGPRAG